MHLSAVHIPDTPQTKSIGWFGFFLAWLVCQARKLVSAHFVIVAVFFVKHFFAKPSSLTSLKKLQQKRGAFSFSLVAQGRCTEPDSKLRRFLSYCNSRFFFRTGVSSSPLLSIQPSSRPKGNRFRRSLSCSLLLLVLYSLLRHTIARSSRCW